MDFVMRWIWIAPILPLIGFLFHAFFGKKAGKSAVAWTACTVVFASFAIFLFALNALLQQPSMQREWLQTSFNWLDVGNLSVPFELRIDPLSILMCLIITGVGGLIHLYATKYMAEDKDHARFFTYFNLFIFFMLVLVLANNLLVMFIGWEGVGLCSYLLIGFWYEELENARAGNKAFIVNRIGDVGFLLGMFILFAMLSANGGAGRLLSFDTLFSASTMQIFSNHPALTTAFCLLMFLGACGKSAQLPLYFWLPDAMAGPTPVSALIHAATMVTAGVVLVTRLHTIFELSHTAMLIMAIVGAATALFAATIAVGQTDIKKVLAYSTVSQLGYMFLSCGVGAFGVGMFHVTTHAFFKALLFLGAGSVILSVHHEQDMRRFGALSGRLRITLITMIIGGLAISGIPPLAGFFSKDEILAKTYSSGLFDSNADSLLYIVGLVTAGLTAFYMMRMMGLTFFGNKRWSDEPAAHANGHEQVEHHPIQEQGFAVQCPLVVLAVLSVCGGWALSKYGPLNLEKFLMGDAGAEASSSKLTNESVLMIYSVGIAAVGIALGWIIYGRKFPKFENKADGLGGLQTLAREQWGYDNFVSKVLGMRFGGFFARMMNWIDVHIVDGFIKDVIAVTARAGSIARFGQNGQVRNYAFTMLFGVIVLLSAAAYINFKR